MDYIEKKLEKAEKAAEELWKEVYEPKPETEPEPKEPEPKIEETVEKPEEPVEETAPEPAPKEEGAEVVATETTEEPKEEPKGDVDYKKLYETEKQKYQTLEGKYRVEVPRLSAEIGQWKEYATSLQNRITALEEASKVPPKREEPETDPDLEAITDPDVARIIKKMKADHKAEIAALRREFETGTSAEIKNIKSDLQLTRQERFDMAMRNAGVPDWKDVDRDPAFIEWLNTPVPYTKATKLQLLQEAARNLDAETTSQFFLDFKASLAPATVTEPDPGRLDKFTAPPRSGGPTPAHKSVQAGLTWDQYRKFMDPRRKFNSADYGGKTEVQVEALFDAAIQKGTLI